MDLINAKTVSITSSFVESKVQFYIKLLFAVLHFTVRMHLGMQKNNYQHNCCFLYFLKKYLHPMHFKAKKLRFDSSFLLSNSPLIHLYNYQTPYVAFFECFKNS